MSHKTNREQAIIDSILNSYQTYGGINHPEKTNLPSKQSIHQIIEKLKHILFPGFFETIHLDAHHLPYVTGQKVVEFMDQLLIELKKSLTWKKENPNQATEVVYQLLETIPQLRTTLQKDIQAIYYGDPASGSEPEVLLCAPGFLAILVYRIAHFLYQKNIPLIPRIMSEIVHSETGIDIHPGAQIGEQFCIDHGTGIVIGETAIIGNQVKLYQAVTIGALSVPERGIQGKRHPTLEDQVIVYSGATILGGNTTIGKGSIIGGNIWLTRSVPPHSKIYLSEELKQVHVQK